jgi:hypothetical protein
MHSDRQAMNRQPLARYSLYGIMIKRAIRLTIGVILVLLGLVALFTPFTPGSWLVPIGLEVLGLRILLENRVRAWADARPNSRAARVALRFVSWRPRGWVARWRHRLSRFRTPGVEDRGAIDPDKAQSAEHEARETMAVGGPEDETTRSKDENR